MAGDQSREVAARVSACRAGKQETHTKTLISINSMYVFMASFARMGGA
jgi:hypothetical protein